VQAGAFQASSRQAMTAALPGGGGCGRVQSVLQKVQTAQTLAVFTPIDQVRSKHQAVGS